MSKTKPRGLRMPTAKTIEQKADALADKLADKPYRLPNEAKAPTPAERLDPSERRGKWARDPNTGEKIALGGKIQEIPLNAYEVEKLTAAAQAEGRSLTAFIRQAAMKAAEDL